MGSVVNVPRNGGGQGALEDAVGTPDSILTKYGRVLQSLTLPVQTIGTTTATHVLSNERPRFGAFTRKMTITANTQSELRFPGLNIVPDAEDRSISIDIYVETILDSNLVTPNHPRITFVIGNTTPGSNYIQYLFDAGFVRQGWNTFKMRQNDITNTKFVGNMPFGAYKTVTGTGVDWTLPITYISVQATNLNGTVLHIDNVRQPARAKSILTIGFDANMEIMETHVAPLFDSFGIESYTTFTGVYEEKSAQQGGANGPWERMKRLQTDHGWDIINHTWSHGATTVGRSQPCTLSRTSNVVTVTLASDHGVKLNELFKGKIATATTGDLNGIFDMYADSVNTFKYTAAGADVGSEEASIRTMLSDVFESDTAENRRLFEREVVGIEDVLNSGGLAAQSGTLIWPNNSVPHIDMVNDICGDAGIGIARGARGGFTSVNEFGIDNPLHCGSWDMDSGTTSHNRLSGMKARLQGAIDRGEHIWIYGHYLQTWASAGGAIVDPDAPPGINGNPAPPAGALSGAGGWWYFEMLKDLVETAIVPAIQSGNLIVMRPSKLAKHMALIR